MYHTVFPSQMVVQIMGGHQTNNGQCPSAQNHTLHVNGVNSLHQSDFPQYGPNISGHNRHRTIQTGSPLDLLQLIGVDVPSLRRIEYMQSNNNSSSLNWERRMNTSSNSSIIPFSNYNFKQPTNSNSTKKPSWNNRNSRRSSYRNFSKYEAYNSDSGFSSRSPTPSKHYIDNSLTESSDERDSTISVRGQWLNKKHHKAHPDNRAYNTTNGLISNTSAHQFYPTQRSNSNYDTTNSTSRAHMQNYQNRRRYLSGKNENAPSQRFSRNRKYSEVSNYDMFPGCISAPDRFLARSHLVQVTSTPSNLVTGSLWDDLSEQIWRKFITNQQTEATYKKKMMLWKQLNTYVKTVYPNCCVFLGGSTMNGFGSNDSDVDVCLLIKNTELDARCIAIEHLTEVLKHLKQSDFVEQLDMIHAKVPIITFVDAIRKFKVDMNCNNSVGIKNTHLLYCYSKLDWRVKPLVLVVKLWAQWHHINNAKCSTLSSYSLVLMVIHFLQCGTNPPVLPCLHSMFANKFRPDADIYNINIHEELNIPSSSRLPVNHQSLGELLFEFFNYYVDFDFSQYAISVRLGSKIPKEECRMGLSSKNDPYQWKYLCIEEPFDLTNTARSVYDPDMFSKIIFILNVTCSRLKRRYNLSDVFDEMHLVMIDTAWALMISDEEG
ncbi:PREDICTED: poly(A) RNA polymerase gld-2 homolog A-like [Vollenhovia emeryi]|uniref:poly(A) RNA polymerase gld-2 homolog A-like n=1 Tax=Vollenhovia emeryi TaxID=411798 RepID=UPI0005F524CE|nr:PREDICTED: poly(A) RNA polymerase gld-2 homolog A-like [Vollenhovia emeryi]XP_011876769.1 PREDICTED: poly(A) RNA polymerase gld-2 homolog A-like [Vollenhovia emeryi]XP_011876770.1 PREDICTED: poly(A) RNA polymerase gld-2 homolog A-like [Vollenhovia emeryi]XP_011876771.1 PREDICTED: poly(A) RNA polymerase gld-2 homolog A-like [Vollenhovia emeryi]